ncbi:MAG: hypothetical protein AB1744_11050 [Candidatus Zixiibacteriota bacterium]
MRRACGFKAKSRPGCRQETPGEAIPGTRKSVTLGEQQKSDGGARQVFGDGMHGSSCRVKQGDLPGKRSVFMSKAVPKSRPGRSQNAHSSKEVPETGWSKGA